MTLLVNSDTQKRGDLKTGERVTVNYRFENNENIATMVPVLQPKAAKASTTPAPPKK